MCCPHRSSRTQQAASLFRVRSCERRPADARNLFAIHLRFRTAGRNLSRRPSTRPVGVQPRISPVPCETLNQSIQACYASLCLSLITLAFAPPRDRSLCGVYPACPDLIGDTFAPVRISLLRYLFASFLPLIGSFFSCACALFHFPYLATPLFATLTKTTGVWPNSSHFGTQYSPLISLQCI